MLQEIEKQIKQAAALGEFLQEHKGQDVSVLDLREINNWTDFFVIATTSSKTHMDGLERQIKEYCRENGIEILGRSRSVKNIQDEWRIIDLGWAIIHLMSKQLRDFYELEKIWRLTNNYSSSSSQSSSSSSQSSV